MSSFPSLATLDSLAADGRPALPAPPIFAPEKLITGGLLAPGGTLDLAFFVPHPGLIRLACLQAEGSPFLLQHGVLRLELFAPQQPSPISMCLNQEPATLLHLDHLVQAPLPAVTNAPWRARVTYFGPRAARITLFASFPGTKPLQQFRIGWHELAAPSSEPLLTIDAGLHPEPGRCFWQFPAHIAWSAHAFSLPALQRAAFPAGLPELVARLGLGAPARQRLLLHAVGLSRCGESPVLQLAGRWKDFSLEFPGTFTLRLRNFRFHLGLELAARSGQLSYGAVQVHVNSRAEEGAWPAWFQPLAQLQQSAVETVLAESLADALQLPVVRAGFTSVLQERLQVLLSASQPCQGLQVSALQLPETGETVSHFRLWAELPLASASELRVV